jgi:hypothetical protein
LSGKSTTLDELMIRECEA